MAGQTLERREWDGEAVLFNNLTGATHLLSSTALWVLERLQAAPADGAALAQALQEALQAESEAEFESESESESESDAIGGTGPGAVDPAQVDALLRDLHTMHLITPC